METYGQDAEIALLQALIPLLDRRAVIDVGAERGSFAREMLRTGVGELHAVDPHPDNVQALRELFDGDERVTVHACALGDVDGVCELHVSSQPDGTPLSFGHTLLARPDTAEIVWRDVVTVPARSIASMVASRELPQMAGVLKVDTEGHDLAVLRGLGDLEADVVMVEHWTELPLGLGRCPWNIDDLLSQLQPRGFDHFVTLLHRGEFVTLKWDDGEVEPGVMANVVFVHDRVLDRAFPVLLEFAGRLAEQAAQVGQRYMRAAQDRLEIIEELNDAAEARLSALEETSAELERQRARVADLEQLTP